MTLSDSLYTHAIHLLALSFDIQLPEGVRQVSERRAISSAYYALFHRINATAVALIAPNVSQETNHRIQRWFEHARMKEICGRFNKPRLEQPLLDLIGSTTPPDLLNVTRSFIDLQDARHRADYDLGYKPSSQDAHQLVMRASLAIDSWDRIANTAEANIFILSLLMFKNWEDKFRP